MQQALPIYYALVLAIVTFFGIMLLLQLQRVLVILFISVLFAAALSRPAEYLSRAWIPRGLAVIIIYVAALGSIVLVGYLVVPPVILEIGDLGAELPSYADEFEATREAYNRVREQYPQLGSFDAQLVRISNRITTEVTDELFEVPRIFARVAFDALSIFFISIMIVSNRERILYHVLNVIHPDHRDQWEMVLGKMWRRMGRYVRAKLIVMTIIGAITYVALLIIDVRFPLLLAIIVAIGELVPRIGVWFARVPLFLIAAIDGTGTLIATYIASVVIENTKGYVISPFVEGDQLNIHPLLVFVAVLVGGTLLGVAGAFIAVPAAAMLQVVYEEVILPWRMGHFEDAAAYDDLIEPEPQ